MSKKKKLIAREERRNEKRRRKNANRAQYEAWRDAGTNSKPNRGKSRASSLARRHTHPDGPCGNLACRKCHRGPACDPLESEPGSCLYGKRFAS